MGVSRLLVASDMLRSTSWLFISAAAALASTDVWDEAIPPRKTIDRPTDLGSFESLIQGSQVSTFRDAAFVATIEVPQLPLRAATVCAELRIYIELPWIQSVRCKW